MRKRVIVAGLDGASPELLEKLVAEGELPTFAGLMRDGVYCRLRSTIPPHSGPAWTAFATGRNPGKTGVASFQKLKENSYSQKIIVSKDICAESIWQTATKCGLKCGVMNVPMTHPPSKINGYMVSGLNISERRYYPESLLDEARKIERLKIELPVSTNIWDYCYRQDLIRDIRNLNMFIELENRSMSDLSVIVLEILDRIQHRYWHWSDPVHPAHRDPEVKEVDPIRDAYKIADGFISRICELLSPGDLLIVLSDHGMRGCSKIFFMNKYLEREGLLGFKDGSDFSMGSDRKQLLRNESIIDGVDWDRTTAFMVNEDLMTSAGIRVNLKGREPSGIVGQSDYDDVLDRIGNALRSVEDPESGGRIIESVHRRGDIYHGDHQSLLPDLVVTSSYRLSPDVLTDKITAFVSPPESESKLTPERLTAHHSDYGIFIAAGMGAGGELSRAEIIDVAPTILAALGIPVPADMDGKVLGMFQD
ncbi:MAG TPA: alkaline phosphatase family protein [bacterium]|nr:alkaline phosphatase family protein [bacterium]